MSRVEVALITWQYFVFVFCEHPVFGVVRSPSQLRESFFGQILWLLKTGSHSLVFWNYFSLSWTQTPSCGGMCSSVCPFLRLCASDSVCVWVNEHGVGGFRRGVSSCCKVDRYGTVFTTAVIITFIPMIN